MSIDLIALLKKYSIFKLDYEKLKSVYFSHKRKLFIKNQKNQKFTQYKKFAYIDFWISNELVSKILKNKRIRISNNLYIKPKFLLIWKFLLKIPLIFSIQEFLL